MDQPVQPVSLCVISKDLLCQLRPVNLPLCISKLCPKMLQNLIITTAALFHHGMAKLISDQKLSISFLCQHLGCQTFSASHAACQTNHIHVIFLSLPHILTQFSFHMQLFFS